MTAPIAPDTDALSRGLVVFVVPDFEPTIGGTTRQVANEARALIERGYDALVLTQRTDRSWPREEQRSGLRVVRVRPSGRGPLAMKLLDARMAWWLRRHRRRIAIVHVVMYVDFALAAVAAGLGARTVMAWAGLGDATDTLGQGDRRPPEDGPGGGWRSAVRAALRRARRLVLARGGVTHVGLTDAIASEIAAAIASVKPPAVIPTPVDIERFRPPAEAERAEARRGLGLGRDDVAIVYAGHLRTSKRVDRLVDAVALLREQGRDSDRAVRLFVLGDSRPELDDCSADLRRQVDEAGLAAVVRFTGGVADVRPYLRSADVFVLPSEREGLSNALLEALATGVPCVAPASAGGDQVLDDSCGAVPASGDPKVLAAAIASVADPARWPGLSRGARERALRYSVGAITGEYERLYARLGVAGFEARRRFRRT